jgi:hypothetical protein
VVPNLAWAVEPPTPHDLRATPWQRAWLSLASRRKIETLCSIIPPDVGKKHYDLTERARERRIALWA